MPGNNLASTGSEPAQAEGFRQFIQDNKPYASDLVIPESLITFLQNLNVHTGFQQKIVNHADVAVMSLAAEAIKLLG